MNHQQNRYNMLGETSDEALIGDVAQTGSKTPTKLLINREETMDANKINNPPPLEEILVMEPALTVPTDGSPQTNHSSVASNSEKNSSPIYVHLKHYNKTSLWSNFRAWPETYFSVYVILTLVTSFIVRISDNDNPILPYASLFVMSSYYAGILVILSLLANGLQFNQWILGLRNVACGSLISALIFSMIMILKENFWVPLVMFILTALVFFGLKCIRLKFFSKKNKDLPTSERQRKSTKVDDDQLVPNNTNIIYNQGIVILIHGAAENIIQNTSLAEENVIARCFLIVAGFVTCLSVADSLLLRHWRGLSELVSQSELALTTFGLLNGAGVSSCIKEIESKNMKCWMIPVSVILVPVTGYLVVLYQKRSEIRRNDIETSEV